MSELASDDELKLNRRVFLQYAAAVSATTAAVAAIAMKTDALAQQVNSADAGRGGPNDRTGPYPYHNG